MKLLSIHLFNINSLVGSNVIDFQSGPLSQSGLFAITGPTGSGKSTILDALCLALYNRIPRFPQAISKEVIKSNGLILSKNQKECNVNVSFKIKDKIYLASWSIAYNRNNNLNEREHTIAENGIILEDKISKVTEKIQQIIGLSYEQFIQTILLAQGQFAKLIHSSPDERNKILETITGTQYFRTIGIKIYSHFSDLKKLFDHKLQEINQIQLIPNDELENLKAKLETLVATIDKINHHIEILKTQIAHKNLIEKLRIELHGIQIQFENKKHEVESFKPSADKIELFYQAATFSKIISDLNALSSKSIHFSKNKENIEIALNKVSEEFSKRLSLLNSSFKIDASSLNFIEVINSLLKKFNPLFENYKTEKDKASIKSAEIDEIVKELNNNNLLFSRSEKTLENAQFELVKIQAQLNQIGINDVADIKSKLDSINASKNIYDKALRQLIEKQGFQQKLNQYRDELLKLEAELLENDVRLNEIKEKIVTTEFQYKSLESEVDKLNLAQKLSIYRSQLIENEECPLCGSLHHPAVEYHSENKNEVENQFNKLKDELNHLKFLENNLEKNKTNLQLKKEHLLENQLDISNKLNAILIDLEFFQSSEKLILDLDIFKQKLQNLNLKSESLSNAFRYIKLKSDLLKLIDIQSDYAVNREEVSHLKSQIKQFSSFDLDAGIKLNEFLSELNQLYFEVNYNQEQLNKYNYELSKCKEELDVLEVSMNDKIDKSGFESLNQIIEILSISDQIDMLRKQKQELDRAFSKLEETKNLKEKELIQAQSTDVTFEKEQLEFNLEKQSYELKEFIDRKVKVERELLENDLKLKEYDRVQNELNVISEKFDVWKLINDKLGDAAGKKFSKYIQEITFKRLLYMSNQRLQYLSDRYKLAIDNEQNMMIMDQYMANAVRSVNTLSGGETFKISLAMALGLSDLSAGDVRIDTLFIDEGFGSLDPDAMHDAINLLEQLQNESGKMIGVISHITELKQRITTQIKLTPIGLGQSRITIEL